MKTLTIENSALWRELENLFNSSEPKEYGICWEVRYRIDAEGGSENREWLNQRLESHHREGLLYCWELDNDGHRCRAEFCRKIAEELELQGL
jgi:hypothetical protein